ncbi:MAG: cytochrome c family protein, partial [Candidatus Omnitrophica bacterium]|nr:cytochrome c family protein [Candidatus Omnitrophota bacterium]
MKKIALILALAVLLVSICWLINYQQQVSAQEGAKFIGIDKCKGCHKKEYEDFQARKFAKAWAVLQMRGKTTDPECLKCHATGYGQPGGFVSEEQTPHLKYKQCEACHGPG